MKKTKLELEALNQKKMEEEKEHERFKLEKRTKTLNDKLARSWEEEQKGVEEKKKGGEKNKGGGK